VSFAKITVSTEVGGEWEQKISNSSIVDFFVGGSIGPQVDGFKISNYIGHRYVWVPDVYAEYRNYYNVNNRIEKQKKLKITLRIFCSVE
jgi:hypothetical protein